MVVTALQRFGSRSNSFQSRTPELVRFRKDHARNMSEPTGIPKSESEPALVEPDFPHDRRSSGNNSSNLSSAVNDEKTPAPSAPPSPTNLSRNISFSNSSSYQEDWDAFPSLENVTIFDFLDNLDLPHVLEKWQSGLAAQTEKVRRQREKLKSSSLSAKERVVEEWRRRIPTPDEQLDRYKKRMRDSVDRLGNRWNDTKAVTVREKVSFIAGVLNIFLSGYLIGAHPELFYYWFTAQFCYFMPIRYYTYRKRGYHYFLADLCYFVNILLLACIWIAPRSKRLFISTYCLAYGNNVVAIAMWRNSMVFHSLDKITSLFIHIMPPVTLHCLVHLATPEFQKSRFPAIYAIRHSPPSSPEHYALPAMMLWASVPYAIWQLSYHLFITVRRREKIAAGRPTSFTWLSKSYSKAWIGRLVLSLPSHFQEPAFMLVQYIYAIATMVPCPIWFWSRWASAGFLMTVFIWSIYNGATYYIDVFGKRFQKELEELKKDVAKWQTSPDIMGTPDGLSKTDGLLTPQPVMPGMGQMGSIDKIPLLEPKGVGSTGFDAGAAEVKERRGL